MAARSDETALPLEPARVARLLFAAVAALTLALMAWTALAEVDETARAAGRLVSAGQLQTVSNLEGGTIAAILVRPGSRVAAGQPLVRFDTAQAGAEHGRAALAVAALRLRVARLRAEAVGGVPVFGAGLPPALMADEAALFRARRADRATASAGEAARLAEAERARAQAATEAEARSAAARAAEAEAALIAPLVAKGIEPRLSLLRAEAAAGEAHGAATAARLSARRADAAVDEARTARRAVTNRSRADAASQLAQAAAELAQAEAQLPAADRLERAVVRTPVAGTVNRVLVATPGGSVRPGEPLVEIVPAAGGLVVEAVVAPADIGAVHEGQRATVKVSAYDYAAYGALAGHVVHVSPDAVSDERGAGHYIVRVRLDGPLRRRDGRVLALSPGMAAEVDLLGRRHSVLSYLLNPVTRLGDAAFRER